MCRFLNIFLKKFSPKTTLTFFDSGFSRMVAVTSRYGCKYYYCWFRINCSWGRWCKKCIRLVTPNLAFIVKCPLKLALACLVVWLSIAPRPSASSISYLWHNYLLGVHIHSAALISMHIGNHVLEAILLGTLFSIPHYSIIGQNIICIKTHLLILNQYKEYKGQARHGLSSLLWLEVRRRVNSLRIYWVSLWLQLLFLSLRPPELTSPFTASTKEVEPYLKVSFGLSTAVLTNSWTVSAEVPSNSA